MAATRGATHLYQKRDYTLIRSNTAAHKRRTGAVSRDLYTVSSLPSKAQRGRGSVWPWWARPLSTVLSRSRWTARHRPSARAAHRQRLRCPGRPASSRPARPASSRRASSWLVASWLTTLECSKKTTRFTSVSMVGRGMSPEWRLHACHQVQAEGDGHQVPCGQSGNGALHEQLRLS